MDIISFTWTGRLSGNGYIVMVRRPNCILSIKSLFGIDQQSQQRKKRHREK
jgi:hypothetical protein